MMASEAALGAITAAIQGAIGKIGSCLPMGMGAQAEGNTGNQAISETKNGKSEKTELPERSFLEKAWDTITGSQPCAAAEREDKSYNNDKSSIPLEGKELEDRADVPCFDPYETYPKGTKVKLKSLDGEYILGTTSNLIDPEHGSVSEFTPCDSDSYSKHNSKIDALESMGLGAADYVQKSFWQGAKYSSYIQEFGDYALSKIGITEYNSISYDLGRENCDKISAEWSNWLYSIAPHKGVFRQGEVVTGVSTFVYSGWGMISKIDKLTKLGAFINTGEEALQFAGYSDVCYSTSISVDLEAIKQAMALTGEASLDATIAYSIANGSSGTGNANKIKTKKYVPKIGKWVSAGKSKSEWLSENKYNVKPSSKVSRNNWNYKRTHGQAHSYDVFDEYGNKIGRIDKNYRVDGKVVPEHYHLDSDIENIHHCFND